MKKKHIKDFIFLFCFSLGACLGAALILFGYEMAGSFIVAISILSAIASGFIFSLQDANTGFKKLKKRFVDNKEQDNND
ncbi:hypothetical protein [Vreelandella olivaria]|uniref:hypothetical protein n=1 Tax=Vreelandella olivaria TaxID=390919 RepID=UPI00201F94F7|nr:hypothetical protein [Halomonas olivaria]